MTYAVKHCYFYRDAKNRVKRMRDRPLGEVSDPAQRFWGLALFSGTSYVGPVYMFSALTGYAEPLSPVDLARMRAFERRCPEDLREAATMVQYREYFDDTYTLRGVPQLKGEFVTDLKEL